MLGRRAEYPDLQEYLYNDNTMRVQKEVSLTSGNTKGRYDRKRSWQNISEEKIEKRKRNIGESIKKKNLSKINF